MKEIWNIAVLASKDPNYTNAYDALLKDVESLGPSHNIRFIFFEFNGKPIETKVFKYLFNSNKSEETAAADCSDLYNLQHIITFFKNHVVKKDSETETNRYMVITWGHGAGLGVLAKLETPVIPDYIKSEFTNVAKYGNESSEVISFLKDIETQFNYRSKINNQLAFLKANLVLPKIIQEESIEAIEKTVLKGIFKNNITDNPDFEPALKKLEQFTTDFKEKDTYVLTLLTGQDLDFVFNASFEKNKKIDVLITINCFTQMLELGLGLKSKVSLLVAPQTMIPFYGVNYEELFKLLNSSGNSSLSLKKISKNITSYFWPKYIQPDLEEIYRINYENYRIEDTSFSCNNLEHYSDLEELIGQVGRNLLTLKQNDRREVWGIITEAREKCKDISPGGDYGVIDFTLFFQNVLFGLQANRDKLDPRAMEIFMLLNNLFYKLITEIRQKSNLSIMMCEGKNYVALDVDDNSHTGIDYVSLSPFFISIFFPGNKTSIMQELLRPKLGSLVDPPITEKPSYKDWYNFVIELFNSK